MSRTATLARRIDDLKSDVLRIAQRSPFTFAEITDLDDTSNELSLLFEDGQTFPLAGGPIALSNYVPEVGHKVLVAMNGRDPIIIAPPGPPTSAPPEQVTGLVLTPGIASIVAKWDDSNDLDVKWNRGTYDVQIDTANTFDTGALRTIRTPANAAVLTDLAAGTTYYVRVRAVDLSGVTGDWSDTESLEPLDPIVEGAGIEEVGSLPVLPDAAYPSDRVVILTTDHKLYRNAAGTWTAAVPTVDLTGTIATAQIAAGAVTSNEVAAATLTGANIAAATIAAGNIVSGTITTTQIAAATIVTGNIAAGTITGGNIAALTIAAGNLVADTITAGQIAANAIGTTELNADSVTSAKIAANTIVAGDIAAGTITTNEIAALTIVAGNIAASTITGAKIAATTITSGLIAADAIIASKLAAISIEAGKYVRSTSYSAGVSGWTIEADGSAEFNNVTVRGRILASQIAAPFGPNLVSNGTFESNVTGWAASGGTLTQSTTFAKSGTGSAKLVTSSGTEQHIRTPELSEAGKIAVTADVNYLASAWVRNTAVGEPQDASVVAIRWYTAANAFISEDRPAVTQVGSALGAFGYTAVFATAPSTAAYASVRVYHDPGPSGGSTHYTDDVALQATSRITSPVMSTAEEGVRISVDGSNPTLPSVLYYTGSQLETAPGYFFAAADSDGLSVGLKAPTVSGFNSPSAKLQSNTTDSVGLLTIDAHRILYTHPNGSGSKPFCPLLAYIERHDGSITNLTTTSTTYADLDATGLVVTFVAPKSGKVIVTFNGVFTGTANIDGIFCVRAGTTTVTNSEQRLVFASGTVPQWRTTYRKIITGLTSGTSYTWKIAWKRSTASGGGAGTLYCSLGGEVGPVTYEVYGILE